LDFDQCYEGLGATKKEREKKYEDWIKSSIPNGEWEMIRKAIQRGQLTGSPKFVDEMAEKIGKRIEFRGQGRPKAE